MDFIKYLKTHPSDYFAKIIEVTDNYYIEEIIEGRTLENIVEENVLSRKAAKKYMLQLCEAVSLLHSFSIIHRDIKPANIIITPNGSLKLIDFDIARKIKPQKEKDTQILGTVDYASPEQYGFSQTDERSDIYSMGVVYNYMLTGSIPQRKLAKGQVSEIILKCTSMAPGERYNNTKLLKEDIENEKMKASTLFDKITSYIPGMRSKNIFKFITAVIGYLVIGSVIVTTDVTILSTCSMRDLPLYICVLFLCHVYLFFFFAFLVNWLNISDRFFKRIKIKWLRRVVPALVLFVGASVFAAAVLPEAFFLANPVVFIVNVVIGIIHDNIVYILNIS